MAFPQYQGGSSFMIFSAQGSNPTANCKISGKSVQKVYDKSVKGYVYSCSGGMSSKIQFPKDETKAGLQLIQPYLVLQIFVPKGQHFSLELRACDTQNTRRKMYFSTSFNELKSTPLHCQIPLTMIMRNRWISLALHVPDLFRSSFRVLSFRSLDVIILGPVCKLRKIFTMRNRPAQSVIDVKEDEEFLPPEHGFAPGVDAAIQVVDTEKLKNLIGLSSNVDGNRDIGSAPVRVGPQRLYTNKHVNVAFGSRMPLTLSTVRINANLPHDSKSDNSIPDITKAMEMPCYKASESASRPLSLNRSILPTVPENKAEIKKSRSVAHDGKSDNPIPDITKAMEMPSCYKASETVSRPVSQNRSILPGLDENKFEIKNSRSFPHDGKSDNSIPDITKASEYVYRPLSQNRSILTAVAENLSEIKTSNSNPIESQLVSNSKIFNVHEEAYIDASETSSAAIGKCPELTSKHGKKIQKLSRREEKMRRQDKHLQKESSSRVKNLTNIEINGSPPGSPPTGWDNNSDNFLFEKQFNADISDFAISDDLDHQKTTDEQFIFEGSFNTSFQNDSALDVKDSVHLNPLTHLIQSGILPVAANTLRKSSASEEGSDQVEDSPKVNADKVSKTIRKPVQSSLEASQNIELGSYVEENWDVHEEMDFTETLCDAVKDNEISAANSVTMVKSGREMVDSHSTAATTKLMPSKRPSSNEHFEVCSTYNQPNQQISLLEDRNTIDNRCTSFVLDSALENKKKDKELDLLYDPILDCYYDPKTNRYYELK